jgi:hypothetical protein
LGEHEPERRAKKKAIAGFYAYRKGIKDRPWITMEEIPGVTDRPILVTNGEGKDDAEEWHLIDFGRDSDYMDMWSIYKRFSDGRGYGYAGGWANQLAIHDEVIDLFMALDAAIERPKHGDS